ncbi:hypothetical protein [Butyrivibrio sp. YAB3001]|uniref:hypothetical protein n=1 Tax=Butyrivibrio sp. YAB3001 TaxID=1520812 RepID=UPI0008F63293|nr:hypothetical protein [Butyrivibrio sp. YAB3001]SFC04038.1 hypothetical protein SAMN02910398_01402 [Butyrivibrio sp. YAB3001]
MDDNMQLVSKKKSISLKMAYGYGNIIMGAGFICSSVAYEMDNLVLRISFLLMSVLILAISVYIKFQKKDALDEMFQMHIAKSSEVTISMVTIFGGFIGAFLALLGIQFNSMNISMVTAIQFFVGILFWLQGILFNHFEKCEG